VQVYRQRSALSVDFVLFQTSDMKNLAIPEFCFMSRILFPRNQQNGTKIKHAKMKTGNNR